ncbi:MULTISPECIES: ACP S-malonyltransferase [Paenibacillus]|uniref:ACP S-malonyltransferase n=1 Tax=Paenibacillus TaxID=44249 RepID=UPI0022B8D7A5|nr:ACP S-malonyltransferase [Paenibacillus caseinilyticus]MCZ8521626.1 ACP S-malonyltransferase [Paenibacillus caseinilyticus]
MVSFVFPGQGSQAAGMGGSLFEEYPEITAAADEILGYSIRELCIEDPGARLGQTEFTQPALYVANALGFLKKVKDTGKRPDAVAGHSLGEYNALFAAGAFDFATGLKLVKKRGELMSRAAGGGMAAVVGLTEEGVAEVLRQQGLRSIDMANYNSPKQIVISGPRSDIEGAKPLFESVPGVVMYAVLKTSGAFHSRYMEAAAREFDAYLSDFTFGEITMPVLSNVHARPYRQGEIRRNLADQITHPVKWTESIRYLMGLGEQEFAEIGSGSVLTGLIRRIRAEAEPLVIPEEPALQTVSVGPPRASMPVRVEAAVPQEGRYADERTAEAAREPAIQTSSVEPPRASTTARVEAAVPQEGRYAEERTTEAAREPAVLAQVPGAFRIEAAGLGSEAFKRDYGVKYAYVQGGMYRGISSARMVIRMGKAGMLGFFGTDGLPPARIENAIRLIQRELPPGAPYGFNVVHRLSRPEEEEAVFDLLLAYGVRHAEVSSFISVTPSLVKFRAKGLRRDAAGKIVAQHTLIAKVSRPEVAEAFLRPAPERLLSELQAAGSITPEQAAMMREIPVADDLCVETEAGGVTEGGSSYALLPAIVHLRNRMMELHRYEKPVRIGAAGGIGAPEAAAAAFVLGADFIVTGSVNQLTVEAEISDAAKDLLQQAQVQDFQHAPIGELFEIGVRAPVLKKGLFYPARANKLYDLYRFYNSLDEIDDKNRQLIQDKYLGRSFEEVYRQLTAERSPGDIENMERNPKVKMAEVFKWYLGHAAFLAMNGDREHSVDYQIRSGPALGAFNAWVKGTPLELWRNRHADEIGEKLMQDTARLLGERVKNLLGNGLS